MTNLLTNKPVIKKKKSKFPVILATIMTVGILGTAGVIGGTIAVSNWFDNNKIEFYSPIKVDIKAPIQIKTREKTKVIVKKIMPEIKNVEIDTPIKKYICNKFGLMDCKTALAVAQAESGFNPEAMNLNGGKSLDYGIFQINSVHWKKDGCALKDLVDPYKNVDCAYQIWSRQGWEPWVAFTSGSYLANL